MVDFDVQLFFMTFSVKLKMSLSIDILQDNVFFNKMKNNKKQIR